MAPKSKILKLITVFGFICLFIIILMNIFNNGNSYYYSKLEKRINAKEHTGELLKSNELSLDEFWQNNGDIHHNSDLLTGYNIKEPSTDELLQQLEKNLPNVPFVYSHKHRNLKMEKFKNCAQFPAIPILNYYNNYWQTYTIRNITFQLYGSYYDERIMVEKGPVLRILAMINQLTAPFPTSYCQIWFENDTKPQITPISEYKYIWHPQWGNIKGSHFPYLLTCDIPKSANITGGRIPKVVSIVEHQCDSADNALKVIYDKPANDEDKLPFAVCVKGLDFPYADISARLVEWLELVRLLGAHKVYIHLIAAHPNVSKVLDYYQQQGFVEVQPISLVGGVVALPEVEHWILSITKFRKRLNELIPYNDCFYRHMYKYDYIAVLDVDEVIMPLGNLKTWHDLVEESKKYEKSNHCSQGFAGICVPNVYFPYSKDNYSLTETLENDNYELTSSEAGPSNLFMLDHQYRFKNYSARGYNTKCLQNTQQALTLHNHYALSWLKSCPPLDLPSTAGHLQHYHDVKPDKKNYELVLDRNIERFRGPLMDESTKVLKYLKLLG